MRCLGIIPSRYKSTRAPGKPLTDLAGKTMVQRVWEQAKKASELADVVVATDDQRIFDCASSFGAHVMMTSELHATGSDRAAEVVQRLRAEGKEYDLVCNIQGDMPFINPEVIDGAVRVLAESPERFGISTVVTPMRSEEEFNRPSAVKAVLGMSNEALYFSRAPIPFIRDREKTEISEAEPWGYRHLGLYVYRPDVLDRISSLPQSLPEKREQLEQLRAMCNGIAIRAFIATTQMVEPGIEVDTPEDIERAVAWLKSVQR